MIRANSLLYAVYVCLIVAILCGALLYFANLYNMLNLFYNTREELYVQNESALQYFLSKNEIEANELVSETGAVSDFEMKRHGLLKVVITKSYLNNDTISSVHFVGQYAKSEPAIYLPKFSNPLSYAGKVRLVGAKLLPSKQIEEVYLHNSVNDLVAEGKVDFANNQLPELSDDLKNNVLTVNSKRFDLKDIERSENEVYFNSFMNETIEVVVDYNGLENKKIKGNFILTAKDSIVIDESSVLEDVIVSSPLIRIKKGFKGALQVFASKKVLLEPEVVLQYPSIVSIYNNTVNESEISLGENCKVYGAIVLYGSPILQMDQNRIELGKNSLLIGDLYCTGKVMIGGKVYGSVYANRFFSRTKSASYENCIIDAEIDITKRPNYFILMPLFNDKNDVFGTIKKVQ